MQINVLKLYVSYVLHDVVLPYSAPWLAISNSYVKDLHQDPA